MSEDPVRAYHAANRNAWSQAARAYSDAIPKTVELLRQGRNSMCECELKFLRDLDKWCDRAIHLQCAGGEDSLSLLNLGARNVVGIDISDEMIAVARTTSERLGMNASWYCCDVLDAPQELNGTANLVYTGRGALIWVHDLDRWSQTIVRLLKPGGLLYVFEGHPFTYVFDTKSKNLQIDPEFMGYFYDKPYTTKGWTKEYVGEIETAGEELGEKHERAWQVSAVITALMKQGLQMEAFQEHPNAYWIEFPNLPESQRTLFPNTYSLMMRKV